MVRMARFFMIVLSVLVLFFLFGAAPAQSQTSQEILKRYVADLQNNPNDYALREKIIRHVQTMKPSPAVPREAERFMNRGAAAAKNAKDANDFKEAAAEFEKATTSAPWMANAYYNLGVAQDKAGLHSNAIRSLKLYLMAAPDAPDTKSVQNLIDEIEYRQEKAAKESSPETIATKKQREQEEWLKKLDGRRYTHAGSAELRGVTSVLDVKGKILVSGVFVDSSSLLAGPRGYTEQGRYEIRGRVSEGPAFNSPDLPGGSLQFIYIISEEGDRITEQQRLGNGNTKERIFQWQR